MVPKWIARYFVPVGTVLLSVGHLWAQTDLITYTGIWTTVPVTGLTSPSAITGDAVGNLYIADSAASFVTKIAANGAQAPVGSGLSSPKGIAVDTAGNVYVSSSADNHVYKITPGSTQTLFGSGWTTPVSVAVDRNGNVFVTDNNGLSKVTAGGAQSLLVPSSTIRGVAADSNNNIYYADNGNNEVYEIPAGTTTPGLHNQSNSAQNLYVDAAANVYMAEAATGVQRSDDQFGETTTFGNTVSSYGVWEDAQQNLYIADAAGTVEKLALGAVNFGPVKVCPRGATVTPCSAAQTLHFALDSDVFATIATSQVVSEGVVNGTDYQIQPGGTCNGNLQDGAACSTTISFTPQEPGLRPGAEQQIGNSLIDDLAPPAGPGHPRRIGAGTLVSKAQHPRSRVEPHDEPAGTLLSSVLLYGVGIAPVGSFNTAPIETITSFRPLSNSQQTGVIVDSADNLYITDAANCVVQKVTGSTTTVVAGTVCGAAHGDGGPATSAVLSNPIRTVIDGAGNLYIGGFSCTVRKVNGHSGIMSTVAGNGGCGSSGDGGLAVNATFGHPLALAVDPSGNLFIADQLANVVRRVDGASGIITTIAGTGTTGYTGDGGAATAATMKYPDALALDTAGNLYIADDGNNVIRRVAAGVITTIAGTGTEGYSGDGGPAGSAALNDPEGLGLDASGNLYIADAGNFLVRKVNVTTGAITTAAGHYTGQEGYTGDSGSALQATLSYVGDVAVNGVGEMFIADTDNRVVRVVIGPLGVDAFGSVAVGSSSPPHDVVYSSIGTSPMAFAALQVPAHFNLAGADTTCTATTTLEIGADCILGIELAPIAPGTLTGAVEITDDFGNAPGITQSVFLQGTGTAAVAVKLAFAAAIPSIVAGGNPGSLAIGIETSAGALVNAANSQVALTINGPAGFTHSVTVAATNGVAIFNLGSVALTIPGIYTLTATSPGLSPAVTTLTVTGGSSTTPAMLTMPAPPPPMIASGGNLGIVPVTIANASGTVIPGATNTVTLTINGPGGYLQTLTIAAVNGVAGFNLTTLVLDAPGTYNLTATSGHLVESIATVTVTTDFILGVTTDTPASSVVVLPGMAATFSLTLAPASGIFPPAITLTAIGLPPGATYSFSPATVTPGSSPVTTTLTIQTVRPTSASLALGWGAFTLLLLPLASLRRMRSLLRRGLPLALLAFAALAGLAGCKASGFFGQPQQNYTITVTGTSGNLSHSTTVTLTIE